MATEFGGFIRRYRKGSRDPKDDSTLTQARLAELITERTGVYVDPTTIAYWESGKHSPGIKNQREVLLALVCIFARYGRLDKLKQADAFLASGGYSALNEAEPVEFAKALSEKTHAGGGMGRGMATTDELDDQVLKGMPFRVGNAPRPPSLIVGREGDMNELRSRLTRAARAETPNTQVLTSQGTATEKHTGALAAVRGWPGVGKTTIAAALAYDSGIIAAFPDGVLWVSLGQKPSVLSELATWGRALGLDLSQARTIEEASTRLAAAIQTKRLLLIIDDVWDSTAARAFLLSGPGSAALITTREYGIAQDLSTSSNDVFWLPVLTEEKALELLGELADFVLVEYPNESRELVKDLEGLPLALQVAGRLLQSERNAGFSVVDLLAELREGAKLLKAKSPPDRTDFEKETTPTVAALLQKSTDRLDPVTRDCFALLGPFAPKPATFDLAALKWQWQMENPKTVVQILVDRGLLEYVPDQDRYQLHSLLVMHAKSLLTDD